MDTADPFQITATGRAAVVKVASWEPHNVDFVWGYLCVSLVLPLPRQCGCREGARTLATWCGQ